MQIINLERVYDFGKKHADARKSLSTWQHVTQQASWEKKQDVLNDFPNAKMLKNDRARFEIKHNKYRLIVFVGYDPQTVVIRFIGSHADYDKINPETI